MTTTYRGKYPERIKSVSIGKPYAGATCVTNDGKRYSVEPLTREASDRIPAVSQDIARFMLMTAHYRVTPLD